MVKRKTKAQYLFYPHVPKTTHKAVVDTLKSRFIGQGPRVDEFEEEFFYQFSSPHTPVAVGSGTDALHLALILAGVGRGDEVICPVFTCTATNIPILYQGAKPVFADVNKRDLNISVESVKSLITKKTKAIMCVDYGGLPCDLKELQNLAWFHGIYLIEDACQAIGARYNGEYIGSVADFTAFSFQAIKIVTTGDGGMLTIKEPSLVEKAKRIRWFGIDREAKLEDRWANDITEVGYKYQMTDIAASMGIEALSIIPDTLAHHRELFEAYKKGLKGIKGIRFIGDSAKKQSSCWLATVMVNRREELRAKLAEYHIESNQVHYRNDMYKVFGKRVKHCPNMDEAESKYLVLPMHYHMSVSDVEYVCEVIRSGW